jgi:LysM repeat protein
MKKFIIIIFFAPLFVLAQSKNNSKATISHTVVAKESFTSIGRQYGVNGRELANFNKLDYEKGLALGQVIKIPASDAKINEAKPVEKTAVVSKPIVSSVEKNESVNAIYHTVAPKETLYHISTIYNKVPIADLKRWNKLTSDNLTEGTNLIVGYGIIKNSKKIENKKINTTTAGTTKTAKEAGQPIVGNETLPPVRNPDIEKTIDPVKKEPVKENIPSDPIQPQVISGTGNNFNGGVFKNIFETQNKNGSAIKENGSAGVFKSTSGWQDGKYYCLHNVAAPGTILKITSTATGKSVYAKVLDIMPDLKQNSGLVLQISNAAADILGVGESKFDCTLAFTK